MVKVMWTIEWKWERTTAQSTETKQKENKPWKVEIEKVIKLEEELESRHLIHYLCT